MTNSRAKGKRGEREFAAFLRERGIEARRGQQYAGNGKSGVDSPDVVTNLAGYHFEVKWTEKTDMKAWFEQATRDAGAKVPIIAHKKNRGEVLAILRMDDLIRIIKEAELWQS